MNACLQWATRRWYETSLTPFPVATSEKIGELGFVICPRSQKGMPAALKRSRLSIVSRETLLEPQGTEPAQNIQSGLLAGFRGVGLSGLAL